MTVLTTLVLVIGLLVSAAVAVGLARQQQAAAADQLDRRATLLTEAVTGEAGRYVDTLRTVAAAAGAIEQLTAATFAEATAPLTDMGLAGATSIVYLVPAGDADIGAVQARWRARGVPDLELQPKSGSSEHIFSIFSRPLDGVSTPRYGIDVTQSAPATQALAEARRSGGVAVSEAYQLIIDQQLPAEQRQMSFSLTAPVHGPPAVDGSREFRGWVLMGLRGRDFIGATLTRSAQNLLDVTLTAPGAQGSIAVIAAHRATVGGNRDMRAQAAIDVADRSWHLDIAVDGRTLVPRGGVLLTAATAALVVLALALAALVYALASGRARADTKVRAATAELAAAETGARQQADLLSAILDNISDGVGVVDHDGRFLLHNPAAKHILGFDADTDGAANWQDHYGMFAPDGSTPFPESDMPLVRALAGECTDQVEMIIRNAVHPQGLTISVSARPLPTADGHGGAVAVFHDITARKAAEADLAAAGDALRTELAARIATEHELRAARDALTGQKTYLTQVLDAIDVTVITCDTSGAIVHSNRTARRALPNADADNIDTATAHVGLSHPDGTLVTVDDTPLMRALRGEDVNGMEATIALPGGGTEALLLHARPLIDATGELIGAVAASYNVTALREREADLRGFAGVAAHDLKAPLAAVAGYAEILDEDLLDTTTAPMVRTSLTRIRSGVDRMRRLIDDLLHYATARDADLHLQPVDLNEVVTDVIAERTAHLRSTTTADGQPVLFPDIYTGPLPTVPADPAMIRQLLDNLIGNAIKYAVPGQPARIDISAHRRAGDTEHRIVIADRGIGIPDAEKPHVFTSFHRAGNHGNRPGTGLGLAICHRIIDRHHGSIAAGDNPGGGTRIHFTLPAADHHAASPTPLPAEAGRRC